MPPIRRVLVLAVDGVQSLDVMGPIEVFCDAKDQVPGTYRIDVAGPGRAPFHRRLGLSPAGYRDRFRLAA